MSLLEKFLSVAKPIANRETAACKLMSYTGFKDAIVDGVAKARISVTLKFGETPVSAIIFKDSVYGLPNYVPSEGIEAMATIQEKGEYINVISLGVKA